MSLGDSSSLSQTTPAAPSSASNPGFGALLSGLSGSSVPKSNTHQRRLVELAWVQHWVHLVLQLSVVSVIAL